MKWIFLITAIIAEVIATTALKYSEGFTKLMPSIIVALGYSIAFYFLSLTLKSMSVGIAYAIWSGLGTVFIVIAALLFFNQKLDLPAIIGLVLIIAGVIVINVYSDSLAH
ncbi:MAG: multidrug efflux SMR transporter [Bacteroidota bacterium]